jgi:hypothetical protein
VLKGAGEEEREKERGRRCTVERMEGRQQKKYCERMEGRPQQD